MKRIFRCLALVFVVMMCANGAWAWNAGDHVKVSPGNKGDLLIFPFYYAVNGGWETKLTVVNTSTQYSTVAKLIIRSHLYSQEVLDFLLYLTPADVWTGMVRNDGTRTYIYSEDDSALTSPSVFASKTNPINQQIFEPRCTTTPHGLTDSSDYGYIEVIESWYGDLADPYYANGPAAVRVNNGESSVPPVSKTYLKRVYDLFLANRAQALPGMPGGNGTDQTINVLAGFFQFQNPLLSASGQGGLTSGAQAVAFADYNCISQLTAVDMTGLLAGNLHNSIGEIEAALAKDLLAMPYVNNPANGDLTVHLFNFPTKLSNYDVNSTDTNRCRYIDGRGPFWNDPISPSLASPYTQTHRGVAYNSAYYDLMEKSVEGGSFSAVGSASRMFNEVEVLHTGAYQALFTEGWTNYDFAILNNANALTTFCSELDGGIGPNCAANFPAVAPILTPGAFSYTGVPVIGMVLEFVNNGLKLFEAAYTDGIVFTSPNAAAGTAVNYQYTNDTNVNNPLGRNSF